MPEQPTPHRPDDPALVPPRSVHDVDLHEKGTWQGPTYYGRSQLKPAPFNNWVVGGYVFLAAVSGASALLATVADLTEGRAAARTVRHGRYLSLLAPTIGAALLVWDLHTPKRFYNMLRVAKGTSPMSIGTWILLSFTACAFPLAGLQFLSRRAPWLRYVARVVQIPAAIAGAGLTTYTSALLSATSTPLWAAAPKALAARFSSSAIAAGAAALSLLETSASRRRKLDTIALAALSTELAAGSACHRIYQRKGVAAALQTDWGRVEENAVTRLGTAMPIGLHALSLAVGRGRPGGVSDFASLAILAGSLLLRVSIMEAGDESASRPDISFRFSQPENL